MPAQTNVACGKAVGIILPRNESIAGECDIMIGKLDSSHHRESKVSTGPAFSKHIWGVVHEEL